MGNEASGAYGELYDVAGSNTITTGSAGVYSPVTSLSQGKVDDGGGVVVLQDTGEDWSASVRYPVGTVVRHNGVKYTAKEAGIAAWDIATTYAAGDTSSYGGEDYISLSNANTGHVPNELGSDWWALANINKEPDVETDYWTAGATLGDSLKIISGGLYRVKARVVFTGDAGSVFTWKIYKNGAAADAKLSCAITGVAATEHTAELEGLLSLVAGDEIDLRVAGSAGSETVTLKNVYLSVVRLFVE